MIGTFYGPVWFAGKDIIIDLVSILVLLLIAGFSLKYYRLYKRGKSYLFLSLSFLLLSISFLIKAIINFLIYYGLVNIGPLDIYTLSFFPLLSINSLFSVAFFLYQFLTLMGIYILYTIYQKQTRFNFQSGLNLILMGIIFAILIFFVYQLFYLFYFISALMLSLITFLYYKNYLKGADLLKKPLLYSFFTITTSQVIFMFTRISKYAYFAGEVIQLVGYILLLITFITVLFDYGRKKNKN